MEDFRSSFVVVFFCCRAHSCLRRVWTGEGAFSDRRGRVQPAFLESRGTRVSLNECTRLMTLNYGIYKSLCGKKERMIS